MNKGLNRLGQEIYESCEKKGWNENLVLGNMLVNVHGEVSEAWEEIRNGHAVTEVYEVHGKPEGFPIEMADTIIRILHICANYKIDIEGAIEAKMRYNETRPYRHGGKVA